jgi:transposase
MDTPMSIWYNVIYSDGEQWCCRGVGEANLARNLKTTKQQGGGGLMVWGFIPSEGVGRLYCVEVTMNSSQYIFCLSSTLLPFLQEKDIPTSHIFWLQGNARAHTAQATQKYIEEVGLNTMPWPPESPDMNIIEHFWAILKSRIKKRKPQPSNLNQLWLAAQEEWYSITKAEILRLFDSIPDRILQLYEAKGWYTDY